MNKKGKKVAGKHRKQIKRRKAKIKVLRANKKSK